MELLAALLLVLGYGATLPVVARMRVVFAERRTRWFNVLMGAMVVIVVGHLLAGRPLAAAINVVGAVALTATWRRMGRRQSA